MSFSRSVGHILVLGLHLFGGIPTASSARAAATRPNIVVFLVDDMGWQDTSVPFHSEPTVLNRHFRTPNMERLARSGVKFTQAYSAAVCSPTRTAIMTGQNPSRHRVTNWTLLADRDQSGKNDRLRAPDDWRKEGLQPENVTLPKLLRRVDYHTIHCGKAHWGAYDTLGADPQALGFDINIAGHPAGAPGHYHGEKNYGNKMKGSHSPPWGVPGLASYHGSNVHLTDALTRETLKELDRAVLTRKPFYLYFAPYAVHAPIQAHPRFVANYRGKHFPADGTEKGAAIDEKEARYASMVEGMDASLGAILDHLEVLGVAENTIVVFTSDNGGLSAVARGRSPQGKIRDDHNGPLREGKGSAYEGGTRVPFIASWAKRAPQNRLQARWPIRARSQCAAPIMCEDIFPTVLRWTGVAVPDAHPVDGRDISGLISSQSDCTADARPLIFHYPHVWGPRGHGYRPHSSIRLGDWKAIWFYGNSESVRGTWELYDIRRDLGETRDLAAEEPARLRTLSRRLRTELTRAGAQYPQNRKTHAPEAPLWR